jgi:hypothetical protein
MRALIAGMSQHLLYRALNARPELRAIREYLPALIELPPGGMPPFLERNDPAGYLSTALLSFALHKEPSPFLQATAETYFRRYGIQISGKYAKGER